MMAYEADVVDMLIKRRIDAASLSESAAQTLGLLLLLIEVERLADTYREVHKDDISHS